MTDVVVVTGASAGVGRATALRFAEEGAALGLIARGRERLEATAREIEAAGSRALVLPADVADPAAVEDAAARAERELGEIEVWVNNAMATIFAPLWEIEPEEYRRATEVTYLGTVWGTMAALRRMRARDRGTIVQVGSALAYRAIPLQAPYCGAKAAIKSFTEGLRTELMHERSSIRLTMVQLPAHNTPQFDWGRTRMPRHPQPVPPIFQPEVAAEAIVHAARHPRRELLVGWPRSRSSSARSSRRDSSTGTWPGTASTSSRRMSRSIPTARTTCSSRRPGTTPRTAASTTSPRSAACCSGSS